MTVVEVTALVACGVGTIVRTCGGLTTTGVVVLAACVAGITAGTATGVFTVVGAVRFFIVSA